MQKMEPPTTPKGCRSSAGEVNFLDLFCKDLQKPLKPIYDLTRKSTVFQWGSEQKEAVDETKSRQQRAPSASYA